MELKYKVGDKVEIISEYTDCFEEGEIVVIKEVDSCDSNYPYLIADIKDEDNDEWVGEDDIELYKEYNIFKVGDRVRIRQWDDMAAEFGVDNDNDFEDVIRCDNQPSFVEGMKNLCGRTATIKHISDDGWVQLSFDGATGVCYWNYGLFMLEPEFKHKYKVGDKVVTTELRDFGGCTLFPVGTVAEIVQVYDGGYKLPYRLSANNTTWMYSEDMFKLYIEEPIEPEPPKAEPKKATVRSYEDMLREML